MSLVFVYQSSRRTLDLYFATFFKAIIAEISQKQAPRKELMKLTIGGINVYRKSTRSPFARISIHSAEAFAQSPLCGGGGGFSWLFMASMDPDNFGAFHASKARAWSSREFQSESSQRGRNCRHFLAMARVLALFSRIYHVQKTSFDFASCVAAGWQWLMMGC